MNIKKNVYIPLEVATDDRLKPQEKMLYGWLLSFSYDSGTCESTNRELSELLRVGIDATSKYLRSLEEFGYITRCVIKTPTKEVEKRVIFPKAEHIEQLRMQLKEITKEECHDQKN